MTYKWPKWLQNQLSILETSRINDSYHIQSKKFQKKFEKQPYSDTVGGSFLFWPSCKCNLRRAPYDELEQIVLHLRTWKYLNFRYLTKFSSRNIKIILSLNVGTPCMKDPPYTFACFSKLKIRKIGKNICMADPLKCRNVLLNMCQNLLAVLHSNFLCTHIKYEWLSSLHLYIKDRYLNLSVI